MATQSEVTRVDTLVIGGGQAGLVVGYHLARRGLPYLIVDGHERIGESWRRRWDSLRLFTPARYAGLSGARFPGRGDTFPSKDDLVRYLEDYVRRFDLEVRLGVRIDSLAHDGARFVATSGTRRFEADHVVVAMANYQVPRTPAFATELDPAIRQIHSDAYRNPTQLADGPVLVVGVGNSGADIALELSRTRRTWLAGRESGAVPFALESAFGRNVALHLVRFLGHHVLSLKTPMGRKLRPRLLEGSAPLVRVRPVDLVAAGVERVPRVVGVRDGRPLLADERVLDAKSVVWCTGYEPGFSWIHLPAFAADGAPLHERGIVDRVPGLYFVGLHFLYAMTSATLTGVGRDADRVVRAIAARARHARPARLATEARIAQAPHAA
ncbi:MAG TPA: NAD(P)/FAD-dependent oxidoreductase [Candidatus Saccharimonadaceae bacterium]|jgi:putative flavoprotein involved in K+ transport|nr:NAD(P)/FAD-dependent oxidoreductase [Candidatus Saccharimonadaceae bacterium]